MFLLDPYRIFILLWAAWGLSWIAASFWSSRPARVADNWFNSAYRPLLLVGALLIAWRAPDGLRLWRTSPGLAWGLDLLALAGFAFCWWARLHLGRLWSAAVTIKPDQRIVESGPYGLVRHPIYTGLLAAILAGVVMRGTLSGIAGGLIMLAGIYQKARLEERELAAALGAAAYADYARRVPMLIPFLHRP